MADSDPTVELPSRGGWLREARTDPITGLVAFPDFHAAFGRHLIAAIDAGRSVGVAIGDVDHLKQHVENTNATDPESFGHLAGNALMARLGELCGVWFRELPYPAGCVSTFGGDEVIVAVILDHDDNFQHEVAVLRDRCRHWLPCTVSFGLTVVTATQLPDLEAHRRTPLQLANQVLAGVDKALFACKAARRDGDAGLLAAVDITHQEAWHVVA
jgi:GGDEF domain-containing protein